MIGKETYRAGVRLWFAGDNTAALAMFSEAGKSSDEKYRHLSTGFVHYLSDESDTALLQALQEFAEAELLGFSDFPMVFAVGHIAWKLQKRSRLKEGMSHALLKQLAYQCFNAVKVEMPKPMLFALEKQYKLSVSYITAQLENELGRVKENLPEARQLLESLLMPDCNLAPLADELGLGIKVDNLCHVDRLLMACAYMCRRLIAGQDASLSHVLAAK